MTQASTQHYTGAAATFEAVDVNAIAYRTPDPTDPEEVALYALRNGLRFEDAERELRHHEQVKARAEYMAQLNGLLGPRIALDHSRIVQKPLYAALRIGIGQVIYDARRAEAAGHA